MCAFSYRYACITRFRSCDFDFHPMILIYKVDLDILKTCLPIKSEVSRSRLSNVRVRRRQTYTDTQTDRRNRTHYRPHSQLVTSALQIIEQTTVHVKKTNIPALYERDETPCTA